MITHAIYDQTASERAYRGRFLVRVAQRAQQTHSHAIAQLLDVFAVGAGHADLRLVGFLALRLGLVDLLLLLRVQQSATRQSDVRQTFRDRQFHLVVVSTTHEPAEIRLFLRGGNGGENIRGNQIEIGARKRVDAVQHAGDASNGLSTQSCFPLPTSLITDAYSDVGDTGLHASISTFTR